MVSVWRGEGRRLKKKRGSVDGKYLKQTCFICWREAGISTSAYSCSSPVNFVINSGFYLAFLRIHMGPQCEWSECQRWVLDLGMT